MGRFCTAPWINISTDVNGSIRPCCRYEQPDRQTKYKMPWMKNGTLDQLYNGPEMKALRQAFLNGEEPEECNWCWKEEAAGISSSREKYYEVWDIEYDLENPLPQLLDLKLSNVCNLKCRMCGPRASSSIAKELNILNPYHLENKIIATDNESIFFKEILPNLKYLELTGGEPFYSPENKKLIKAVSKTKYAKNISLHIITNGMFKDTSILDNMKSFKNVCLAFSVDDIGKRLEYARSNANWETIRDNIFSISKDYPQINIIVKRTINNFNIYYLDELDFWCNENKIQIKNDILHEPKYLCIQNLPNFAKREIEEKFERRYENILEFMNKDSKSQLVEFHNKTKALDKLRKEDYEKTFKEWAEILLW